MEKKIYKIIRENYSIEQMALQTKAMSTRITNLAFAMKTMKTVTQINSKIHLKKDINEIQGGKLFNYRDFCKSHQQLCLYIENKGINKKENI